MPRLSADVFTHAFTLLTLLRFPSKTTFKIKISGAKYNLYNNSVTLGIYYKVVGNRGVKY